MNTTPRFESGTGASPTGELLGELQSGSGEDRVEVWRRVGPDGAVELELLQYHWGSGVGWYVQKSMTLDAAQAALLAGLLGAGTASHPDPFGTLAAPSRPRPTARQDGNLVQLLFS